MADRRHRSRSRSRRHRSRSRSHRSGARSPHKRRARSQSPHKRASRSRLPLTFPLEFQNQIEIVPERRTKLYVSNLGDGVSNNDIFVLFLYIGSLNSSTLKYDKIGRPTGIAEVVFNSHLDAMRALRKYQNLALDGRPMKIKVVEV